MKAKCPHCSAINDHTNEEMKQYFLKCLNCGKQYRYAETSPIMTRTDTSSAIHDSLMDIVQKSSRSKGKRDKNSDNLVGIHNSRATSYYKMGKIAEAYKEFQKSLRIRPEQPHIMKIVDKIENEMAQKGIDF